MIALVVPSGIPNRYLFESIVYKIDEVDESEEGVRMKRREETIFDREEKLMVDEVEVEE